MHNHTPNEAEDAFAIQMFPCVSHILRGKPEIFERKPEAHLGEQSFQHAAVQQFQGVFFLLLPHFTHCGFVIRCDT